MAESPKTAKKTALLVFLGILAFAVVCSFLPGTEAYSGLEYYGGVTVLAGLVAGGIILGNKLDKE